MLPIELQDYLDKVELPFGIDRKTFNECAVNLYLSNEEFKNVLKERYEAYPDSRIVFDRKDFEVKPVETKAEPIQNFMKFI